MNLLFDLDEHNAEKAALLGLILLCATPAGLAFGASERLFQVAQPLEAEGPGLVIGVVPYIAYDIDPLDPAAELLLTVRPNSVNSENGSKDRNLAAQEGIRFLMRPDPGVVWERREWPRLRGDTLDVLVDLSRMKPLPPDSPGGSDATRDWQNDVLAATLWCGLSNSRIHWPAVKYVRYVLEGGPALARYGGVYSLVGIQPVDRGLEWNGRLLVVPLHSAAPALAADTAHVMKDLEALYAEQAEFARKRDVQAIMTLDTPDYSVKLLNGKTLSRDELREGMAGFYTSGQLVRQISLTYTIMALAMQGTDAVVLVEQKDRRIQIRKDGKPHEVEADVIHRDTWIQTTGEWKRRLTEEIMQTKFTVDGKPVEVKK